MFGQFDGYQYLWFFLVYAFLGWCSEVIYGIAVTGKYVNRGFFYGPYCPIYGFGAVSVVLCLTPLVDNLLMLFLGSILLTSTLEWVTGFVLEKIFKSKWWDYSDKPFNIGGYVCLSFSIMWGFGCIFVMRILHPNIARFVDSIPNTTGVYLLTALAMIFMADSVATLIALVGLNKRLEQLEGIVERINNLSKEFGSSISRNTLALLERNEAIKSKFDELRPEIETLLNKQKELLALKEYGQKRLIKAFPKLKSDRFSDALEKLKSELGFGVKKEE
jgi:uncharacterized membrane protein